MARMPDGALVTLGPWPRGGNNLAREDSIPSTAFRRGVNVDVYPGGKTRRRKGYALIDDTPTNNGWSNGAFALCTSIDSTVLYRFDPALGPVQIHAGLKPESDLAYCEVNNLIYVSDGLRALRVDTADASVRPWGVPRPAGQPQLSAVPASGGGLASGAYQVAAVYATADGEQGGTLDAASIELPNGGGIRIRMPAYAVESHVASIYIYITTAGSSEFRRHGIYPVGALDISVGVLTRGPELHTMGLDVLPAGTGATLAGGRLLISTGNAVIGSEPGYYGLTNLAKNFVLYPAEVDLIAAATPAGQAPGTFVAAGAKTYFLNGANFRDATNQLAYNAGAVRGAPVYVHGDSLGLDGVPSQPLPLWLAKNGQPCVGLPSGQVIALTNARYAMDDGDRAVIGQRDLDGINQVVVGVRSPTGSLARTGDTATATLVRNGVEIP